MTTDTSAEALEESIFWLKAKYRRHGEIEDRIAAEQLEYFQAEKRRAREGVTDESKTRAWNEYYSNAVSRLTSIHELDVYWAFEGGWDAALEAVWPDGRDAKDAARYRWLRDKSGRDGQPYIRCDDPPFEPMDYWVTAGTADSCIDRAMAKESGR